MSGIGREAGEFRARAGAAGGTVDGLVAVEDRVARMGLRLRGRSGPQHVRQAVDGRVLGMHEVVLRAKGGAHARIMQAEDFAVGHQREGNRGGRFGDDRGDIVVEVKHYGAERMSTALVNGVAELEVEKRNAGTDRGVLVVRRPGKTDPGLWYAVRLVKDDPEIGMGGK